ncbi:MAG: penicillin-binding protein 2 [Rhodobacteraceae bacterium]|nr:penicillin-binding protein 2 [Paracoccaceae bacterium]
MIRRPLRPLAPVLSARDRGENPDAVERSHRREREEARRDGARVRAEGRLLMLGLLFVIAFGAIGARMAAIATAEAAEPRTADAGAAILGSRADIVDRNGRILATNLPTQALYAQPHRMVDGPRAARALAAVIPELDAPMLLREFTDPGRRFVWLRRRLSPEQVQAVHDIGEPGLQFGPREMRLYPNGPEAAHVLGGVAFGREGVSAAEIVGTAGLERALDGRLGDPAQGAVPVVLSLDLGVQAAVREVLGAGMRLMNAAGASAVLMDAVTGEVVALVSLPDFDPNVRPAPAVAGDPALSPLFNRAVLGVYELGSVMKPFAIAQALDLGLVTPATRINTRGPLTWGRYRIRDFRNYGPELSVTDVIVKSSNIGTARIAVQIGGERQQAFLRALGLLDPLPLELAEGALARPLLPRQWSEIATMTIAYGHGLSISPLHLAAGYAALVNGGTRVTPTLLRRDTPERGARVVSEATSAAIRAMLRATVTRGTASLAEVAGYPVGGKTGTADKPRPRGGYYEDRVIATFAAVFPAHAPRYVLVVTLDEPVETSGPEPRRTAGWTAVPVAAEVIRRTAPLLGLRPEIEPAAADALIRVRN